MAGSDDTAAHGKNVGVIVLSCGLCRETVVAKCTAYSLELVCRYGYAYTGTADKDTLFALSL